MALYKMKYFGSSIGVKTKITYNFDKDQEIEAPEGDILERAGERVDVKKTRAKKGESKQEEIKG